MNAKQRLDAGKYLAYGNAPYFRPAIGTMPVIWTEQVPIMGVDKYWRLYINPNGIEYLSPSRVGFILVHEVSHLLRLHHERTQEHGWEHQLANIAWDCEINDMVYPGLVFPESGIKAKDYGLAPNKLGEEYYAKLVQQRQEQKKQQQQQQQQQQGQSNGNQKKNQQGNNADANGQSGNGNKSSDGNGKQSAKGKDGVRKENGSGSASGGTENGGKAGSATGSSEGRSKKPTFGGSCADGVKREWELDPDDKNHPALSRLEQAAKRMEVAQEIRQYEAQQGRGNMPGGWSVWAESVLRPKVRVDKLLRSNMCNAIAKTGVGDKTYRRVKRTDEGVLLPRHSKRQPVVTVVCDTSGSMGSGENTPLHKALSMVIAIGRTLGGVNVVWQDTEPHLQRDVRTIQQVKAMGGGGTDMGKGIVYADEQRGSDKPDVIVCVTDCYTPWPKKPTRAPLVIVDVTGSKAERAPEWAKKVAYE